MSHAAARRMNALLAGFESPTYLEVGVFKGSTFLEIDACRKVAVDPCFQFDVSTFESDPTMEFHERTSDDYFAGLPPGTMFDVVFLDGLHHFEQTLRDFCNAIAHTHDASVIVIDDTVPCDPFSAIRDQGTAVKARQAHGGTSRQWHGDTFKVVLAIHDLFPAYSYATVMDDGNPQTVVWRESRSVHPRFPHLQAIGGMDYFGFLEERATFNPVSRAELEQLPPFRRPGAPVRG